MAVAAVNNTFFVGDWSAFRIYQFENFAVPDVNADPLNLSFGTIGLGDSQSLTFRVENVGQEPLTVTGLEAVGSGFSVESASFTLNPFEDREFTATYTPVSNNDNGSGFINIKSNDPDESEKILPVSGGNRVVGAVDPKRNGFDPHEILTDWYVGTVSTRADGRRVREYEITAIDKEIEIAPGIFFPAWDSFQAVPRLAVWGS